MSDHKHFLPSKSECKAYTLFLDRDGVINEPIINDYAKRPDDFILQENAIDALGKLMSVFGKVIVVTNQQGIHKKLMTELDLEDVHMKLYNSLKNNDIDYFSSVFYAPYLKKKDHAWRKPKTGMIDHALAMYPTIDKSKMMVVGDSPGDMELADNVGAIKIKIQNTQFDFDNQDATFSSLFEFACTF